MRALATVAWTMRGVPVNVREIATEAAENRGMTVGDWISEAVVAFSKADTNRVSADGANVPAPADLMDVMKDVQARLTKLESRDTRGLLGKLFGKSTVATLLLAVFLISGTAWGAATNFGLGLKSCGLWTAVKEESPDMRGELTTWVAGYLTAYSVWVEGDKGGPVTKGDVSGAVAWIDNYCQEKPLNNVAQAAERLIFAIRAK